MALPPRATAQQPAPSPPTSMPTPVTPAMISAAHAAVDSAAKILLTHFRQPLSAAYKEDETPVTVADREAEAAIRAVISAQFPQHAIVGEEMTAKHTEADYVWVIDPIDGTRAFLTGRPTFAILLALVHRGKPVLGVICQPVTRERWVGVVGRQTVLNGEVVKVREGGGLKDCTVQATTPDMFVGLDALAFRELCKVCRNVVYGGDSYAYAMLATGCADLVVEADLKAWDVMALVPVVQGAGGCITDWSGRELRLNSDGRVVAASSEGLMREAVGVLGSVDDDAIQSMLPGSTPISADFDAGALPEDPGPGHIQSMTGFGEACVAEENLSANVQIRSVNSRYCDVQIKLPRALQSIETELVAMVKKEAKRGKLVVNVEVGNGGVEVLPVVDTKAAERVGRLLREVAQASGVNGVSVGDVLGFSEVLVRKETGGVVGVDVVKKAVAKAMENLSVARRREGGILERDLMMRTKRIKSMLKEIEARMPMRVVKEKERLKKLVEGWVEDDVRLEQEVTLFADRVDISEEIVRLRAHVMLFEMTMVGVNEPVGVRLGFLLQEMNRESNTLGAKVLDAPMSQLCVRIKEEVEKVREQCQNIR